MERIDQGQFAAADQLPERQRALHRRLQAAIRAERERKARKRDLDETGRRWPGLAKPKRKP